MQVYVFISVGFPGVSAFTLDGTGGNLPPKYAPWLSSNDKAARLIRVESDPVVIAVKRDGYFVVDSDPLASAR
jgi:hypothetical protein